MAKMKTPRGKAMWAKVVQPDTKWVADGEYSINLVLDGSDDEVKELCADLEELVEEKRKSEAEANPAAYKKLPDGLPLSAQPFKEVEDDNGNETGELQFKFKMKAKIQLKDGSVYTPKPALFDAKARPISDPDFRIGNGSICRVQFDASPYCMPSTKTAGVSLRLHAVQVLSLVEYGGDSDFEEEDGFEFKNDSPREATASESETNWDF